MEVRIKKNFKKYMPKNIFKNQKGIAPLIIVAIIAVIAVAGGVLYFSKGKGLPGAKMPEESTGIKGDVGNDICKEFSADFIYSATGKTVVRVEPDKLMPMLACRYYFSYDPNFYKDENGKVLGGGGAHVYIQLENLNVENQKKGVEFLGGTYKSDPRIKMENMVTFRKNGSIWDIRLIINPNRFVWTDYSNNALTDEQLIDFAVKLAEKIQGNLSFPIKNNPIDLQAQEKAAMGESQQAVASSFLNDLATFKIDDAIKLMDDSDEAKQGWKTNFNTITSLKVNKIEEAFKEEWTSTHQEFKTELDVKVKPEGLQMGWDQGKNYRWIVLEKNAAGIWLIHGIASNP